MPGFVDVSGMTYEDVRRMGHADDYDAPVPIPGRRNTVLQTGHSVSDVWAAACAAQRVNGGYYKETQSKFNDATGKVEIVKARNRDVMIDFLYNPDRLLTDDVEQGEQCRNFLEQDITFRALKGTLTEFDKSIKAVLSVKDRFYTVSNRYELAVAACLPNSYLRSQQRQTLAERLQACKTLNETVGAKVVLSDVEILECRYSQTYNIFFVTAVTEDNVAVYFSAKEKFDIGEHLAVQGKVKAHRDNKTQLNYVKVL